METIEVRYKLLLNSENWSTPIPTDALQLPGPVYHKCLVYTDYNGTEWGARGGLTPDGGFSGWADTSDLKSLREQQEALAASGFGVALTYSLQGLAAGTQEHEVFLARLGVVERFMGFTYGGPAGQATFDALTPQSGNVTVQLDGVQIQNVDLAYERIRTDVYESLLLSSRHKELLAQITFTLDAAGLPRFQFDTLEKTLASRIQVEPVTGILDTIEFISAYGEGNLRALGWDPIGFLVDRFPEDALLPELHEELSGYAVRFQASAGLTQTGSAVRDLIAGTTGDDLHYGRDGDDILVGRGGNDRLFGDNGSDLLMGGQGADVLQGGDGNDVLGGGPGDDVLYGGVGGGSLDRAGAGNDSHIFRRGDGRDVVYDRDTTPGNLDQVVLVGLLPDDVVVRRNGNDLLIDIKGTSDTLRISGWISVANRVERIRFADGTVLEGEDLALAPFIGTDADDVLAGWATNDLLQGLSGDDMQLRARIPSTLDRASRGSHRRFRQTWNLEQYTTQHRDLARLSR